MTDEILDPRFERDLRAVLAAPEPASVPASLYVFVDAVPSRRPIRRGWLQGRMAFAGLAMAAVVVIAVAAAALALRPWDDLPVVGGRTPPPPTVAPSAGLVVTYRVEPVDGVEPGPEDIDAVIAVLQARIAATSGGATAISTSGGDTIVVSVAMDPTDEEAVTALRELLGTTGRVDFVPLGDTPASVGQRLDLSANPPLFSGDQVASAAIGTDQTDQRTVDFTLEPGGARLFADFTAANIGRYFAIVLDGVVISAPVINSAIPDGQVQISQGSVDGYPLAEAQQLVAILSSGALPFPIVEIAVSAGPAPTAPAPSPTASAEPTPDAGADAALVAAARAYAEAAGFTLAPGAAPTLEASRPSYDDMPLRLVALPLADREDAPDALLSVYLDDSGAVLVVEDGAGSSRPTGAAVDRDGALEAAARHFRTAGVDPSAGMLTVVKGEPGLFWYITLDRAIDGYPVANTPAMWRLSGDKAYVSLRGDGTLVDLYAIRPPSGPVPQVLATEVLDERLATVSGLAASELADLDPILTWVRARDPEEGVHAPVLSLGYCVTKARPDQWSGWCVDAGTGEQSVVDGGID
jgi:hypothetical protein